MIPAGGSVAFWEIPPEKSGSVYRSRSQVVYLVGLVRTPLAQAASTSRRHSRKTHPARYDEKRGGAITGDHPFVVDAYGNTNTTLAKWRVE